MTERVIKKVFVAGHRGMVGSAVCRLLGQDADVEIITRDRKELDLDDQSAVRKFFSSRPIDQVYLCAAKVGGIHANNELPAEFIYQNLKIETSVIHEAHRAGINKLLFLGSSCIYPRICPQPMTESSLLTAALEPTNTPYAISKIAGIKLCESYNRQYGTDFRSVMPSNLYGSNDNFHAHNSHVIPALVRRIHEANEKAAPGVSVWGTGTVRREFLYVDDLASACRFVMNLDRELLAEVVEPGLSHLNVGTGVDCTVRELAETICRVVGYPGELEFDHGKPDGTPRKLLDVSKLAGLGWTYETRLEDGLRETYKWYLENLDRVRQH
jgi:GDP-L-fucose synthase